MIMFDVGLMRNYLIYIYAFMYIYMFICTYELIYVHITSINMCVVYLLQDVGSNLVQVFNMEKKMVKIINI